MNNPLEYFNKLNKARHGKIIKSYPVPSRLNLTEEQKQNVQGEINKYKTDAEDLTNIISNIKLDKPARYKNKRYAKSAIGSRVKDTKKGNLQKYEIPLTKVTNLYNGVIKYYKNNF